MRKRCCILTVSYQGPHDVHKSCFWWWVNLGHLVKAVPVVFLCCKVIRFPFAINGYLGGDTLGKKEKRKGLPLHVRSWSSQSCWCRGLWSSVFSFSYAGSGTPCISAFAFFMVFHLGKPLDYTLVTGDACARPLPPSSPAPTTPQPCALPAPSDILCFVFVVEVVLEKDMATHSSILAWRIPWAEEPGGLLSIGSQSQTWLKRLSMHACIGEGNGNPLQYSCLENPMGRGAWWAAVHRVTESDLNEAT